jgi:thioredoxin:protein disulfide reductase
MGSFEEALAHGTLWAFATVFIAGILTSFTPCVYPMIPITLGIFGAREATSRGRAFLLATTYVMGIAAMYTGLGILAALGGWAGRSLLATPWFVLALSVLFIVLATSMFGLWEMRLPEGLQNALARVGGKGYGGAFVMGLVGGILIAPCTGPILAGVLTYVATTRNVAMGGGLLFTYALGIGVLFWIIASFAMALPRSGSWMEAIKSILGVGLLVAALYFLQNVSIAIARYTSGSLRFALLNLGLVVIGVALGGVHLTYGTGALRAARKTLGVLLITLGAFGLVNFALSPRSKLPWIYEESEALALARKKTRPVLIDFWAISCTPCKLMEAKVLSHPAVRRELERFVIWKVDVSKDTDRDQMLQEKYRTQGQLPMLILLDPTGAERGRAGKVESVAEMLKLLRGVR